MCFITSDPGLELPGFSLVDEEEQESFWDRSRRAVTTRINQKLFEESLASSAVNTTSPFAVFGPRIGVQNISDVRPGERGRRVTIADLKIGLE